MVQILPKIIYSFFLFLKKLLDSGLMRLPERWNLMFTDLNAKKFKYFKMYPELSRLVLTKDFCCNPACICSSPAAVCVSVKFSQKYLNLQFQCLFPAKTRSLHVVPARNNFRLSKKRISDVQNKLQ